MHNVRPFTLAEKFPRNEDSDAGGVFVPWRSPNLRSRGLGAKEQRSSGFHLLTHTSVAIVCLLIVSDLRTIVCTRVRRLTLF